MTTTLDDNPLTRTPDAHAREFRYKRVLISLSLLQSLCTQDSTSDDFPWSVYQARCIEGLPADARLVHSYVTPDMWPTLTMVFEHSSFDAVPEGHEIPVLPVTFQQRRRDNETEARHGDE